MSLPLNQKLYSLLKPRCFEVDKIDRPLKKKNIHKQILSMVGMYVHRPSKRHRLNPRYRSLPHTFIIGINNS